MPAGRPQKEINKELFEELCSIFCTLNEIAGCFKCSEDTIERWCKRTYNANFAEVFKIYSADGKISLRRKQKQIAEEGNVGMLIFLGKQYLGQKENPENDYLKESIDKLDEYLGNLPK